MQISRYLGVAVGYGLIALGIGVGANLLRILAEAALAPRFSVYGYLLTALTHLGAMLFVFVGGYATLHRVRHPLNPTDGDLSAGLKYFR